MIPYAPHWLLQQTDSTFRELQMTSRLASDGSRRPAVRVFDADHIEEQSSDLRSESLQARAGKWASTKTAAVQHMGATYSFLDWLAVALPCVTWIRRYKVRSIQPFLHRTYWPISLFKLAHTWPLRSALPTIPVFCGGLLNCGW